MTRVQNNSYHFSNKFLRNAQKILLFLIIIFIGNNTYAQNNYNPESADASYTADIVEINPQLTKMEVNGTASFIVSDGKLYITIIVKGLEPSMMHLMHIHGFKDSNQESYCAGEEADLNNDGIIDLMETHMASGVTLIPFNAHPADLKILSDSYPVANKNGLTTYRMAVSMEALKAAVKEKYGMENLSLENRIIYIHGVPKSTPMPESVQSLPNVPAQVTIPLACGEIKKL